MCSWSFIISYKPGQNYTNRDYKLELVLLLAATLIASVWGAGHKKSSPKALRVQGVMFSGFRVHKVQGSGCRVYHFRGKLLGSSASLHRHRMFEDFLSLRGGLGSRFRV